MADESTVKDCNMHDRDIISKFVQYLRDQSYPDLKVDRWPEDDAQGEIDAAAGPFRIEHTSIDTLPNQRCDDDWFMRAAGNLEKDQSIRIRFRLNITIENNAITKGQDWPAIQAAFKKWILEDAQDLPDGFYKGFSITGVPFQVWVRKNSERPPRLSLARLKPGDDTLPDRIKELLDRKISKLIKHQGQGKITLLLIENNDIALMNAGKMLDSLKDAYPDGLAKEVDQVWYVDSSVPAEVAFEDFTAEL